MLGIIPNFAPSNQLNNTTMAKIYGYVEINYFNEEQNFWCVDAWRTDNDFEEGKVVGVIHESGDAYIFDADALICENVKEEVAAKVAAIKANRVTINPTYEEETIEFRLDPNSHPKAYGTKKAELMANGMSEKEAEDILKTPFVMELYYSKDNGLFAVESESLEFSEPCDPYTGIKMAQPKD